MALTFTVKPAFSFGSRRAVLIEAAGTNAAGGTAVTPSSFGLTVVDALLSEVGEAGKELVYDRVAGKVTLFDGGTEDTSTDTTSKTIRAIVIGR
jgi:hypothetical protein